jgi:hypothetical protein
MKRFLAFVLLLSHMNTSMLLPQVPEDDVYDANGNQVDDINSVVEYVMVKLGLDHHADDEDDDSGQNFHVITDFQYTFEPYSTTIDRTYSNGQEMIFRDYFQSKIPSVSYDILVPPPKA